MKALRNNELSQKSLYASLKKAQTRCEKKTVEGIEVKLGVNAHMVEPRRYWYYVNIGTGWGYCAEFGPNYSKAKRFYDRIGWFAITLKEHEAIADSLIAALRDTWKTVADISGGKHVETPPKGGRVFEL